MWTSSIELKINVTLEIFPIGCNRELLMAFGVIVDSARLSICFPRASIRCGPAAQMSVPESGNTWSVACLSEVLTSMAMVGAVLIDLEVT
jgi:hypothetical protein